MVKKHSRREAISFRYTPHRHDILNVLRGDDPSFALTPGGQFSASGALSGTADCLQGNLCWALITLGYELDRLAPAIEIVYVVAMSGSDVCCGSAHCLRPRMWYSMRRSLPPAPATPVAIHQRFRAQLPPNVVG